MRKVKDLTGMTFGRWKVVEYAGQNKQRSSMWLCECQCEKKTKKIINGSSLKNGSSQSCGCLSIERAKTQTKERNPNYKGFNQYELINNYVKGYDDKGNYFIIDIEDFDKIKEYRWYKNDSGYWIAQMYPDGKRKLIRMHRFIMNAEKKDTIDHINRNPSDNRKSNLRFCTKHQNGMNTSLQEGSKSSVIGVNYYKASDCWEVHIGYKGKSIYLGHFKNIEEAIKIRLQAEKEYFGEFAPQKRLFEKYNIV